MNLKDPRTQLSYLLILIFASAVFYYKDISLVRNLILATGATVFFDFLFWKLRKIEFFPPAAAITTGIIISLLISTTAPFYEIITASGLAMLSKNFIKGSSKHTFNPAGFGILISSFIFKHPVSWWAVSFQPENLIFFLFLLSPLLISMVRLKRFWIAIPFLIIYSFVQFIFHHSSFVINIFDPTVLFFSLVMLPEPQTTPNKTLAQSLFGVFVALFATLFSKLSNSIDPLIFALLAGNLIFYRLK